MSKAHNLTVATIQEQCRGLRLPTVAAQSERLAQEAARANQSHLNYLAELLGAELEERERHKIERRIKEARLDRKSTRLNSSHLGISYAVFCLKKKKKK